MGAGVRRLRRVIASVALLLVGLPLLYWMGAWTAERIAVNGDYRSDPAGVPVFLVSDGTHVDMVVPAAATCRCDAVSAPTLDGLSLDYDPAIPDEKRRWVAIGWGDEQFMLNVPSWADLTPGVALLATSGMDGSVIRLTSADAPNSTSTFRYTKLLVPLEQYRRLIASVLRSAGQPQETVTATVGQPPQERYYRSRDRYDLFRTCNEWLREAFAEAGIRTGLWTPFAEGLLRSTGTPIVSR